MSDVAKTKVIGLEEANMMSLSKKTRPRKEISRLYKELMTAVLHDPKLVSLVFKFESAACD